MKSSTTKSKFPSFTFVFFLVLVAGVAVSLLTGRLTDVARVEKGDEIILHGDANLEQAVGIPNGARKSSDPGPCMPEATEVHSVQAPARLLVFGTNVSAVVMLSEEARLTDREARQSIQAFEREIGRWTRCQRGGNWARKTLDDVTAGGTDASSAAVRPTIADIERFKDCLGAIPPALRQTEMRRALNLVSDDNAMVLAGVVLDTTEDPVVVRDVFNDIINRPEEVKKPIVEAILKDKTHPCYSDAEWIYEVTGEKISE